MSVLSQHRKIFGTILNLSLYKFAPVSIHSWIGFESVLLRCWLRTTCSSTRSSSSLAPSPIGPSALKKTSPSCHPSKNSGSLLLRCGSHPKYESTKAFSNFAIIFQLQSFGNLFGNRWAWSYEMGSGPLSAAGVDHLLSLHFQGSQVDREGDTSFKY